MSTRTPAEIEAIKAAHPLADLVRASGFSLSGVGRYLKGVEHDSLVVDTKADNGNGVYFWNSQGEIGDVITWVMQRHGYSFGEALDYLAGPGHELPRLRPLKPAAPEQPPARIELPPDLHMRYHQALLGDPLAQTWWLKQGSGPESWQRFLLGVCHHHPLYHQLTYTIPVIEGGRLVNIRHRLSVPPAKGDKYRPHMVGLGSQLFNRDILTPELGEVVLVAGEKKAIVLWEHAIPAISSTAGCNHWPPEWNSLIRWCQRVYLCFDPGEEAAARVIAGKIGPRARVVEGLPLKPDDLILERGREALLDLIDRAEAARLAPATDIWQAHPRAWGRLLKDIP